MNIFKCGFEVKKKTNNGKFSKISCFSYEIGIKNVVLYEYFAQVLVHVPKFDK